MRFLLTGAVALFVPLLGSSPDLGGKDVLLVGDHAATCLHCAEYPDNEHAAPLLMPPERNYSVGDGWHDSPWSPNCTVAHGVCGGEEDDTDSPDSLVDEVRIAVAAFSVDRLAGLVRSDRVLLNRERGAIQVLACDGVQVYGHLPLGKALIQSLQAELDQ